MNLSQLINFQFNSINSSPMRRSIPFRFARSSNSSIVIFSILLEAASFSSHAIGPQNGQVSFGNASITQSNNLTTITQSSSKAAIDWNSFSIGKNDRVNFIQPSSSAITLNRVTGNQISLIDGALTANGSVWLLNPNGVLIGPSGQISVGNFLTTNQYLSNQQFSSGNYAFSANPLSGTSIQNQGNIIIKDGGYAILAGETVRNDGYIQANLGQVVLAGAKTFTIDLNSDKLISFAIKDPLDFIPLDGKAVVDNQGSLQAQGGRILLTTRAAAGVIGQVINTSGVISATSASLQNGSIILDGGNSGQITVGGVVDASGKNAQQTGGNVQILGNNIQIQANSLVNVSGDSGGGNIRIGSGQATADTSLINNVNMTIAETATINASALNQGNGGEIMVWSDPKLPSFASIHGNLISTGGLIGGNGGFIETSSYSLDLNGIRVNTTAPFGKTGNWLIDPDNIIFGSGTSTATTTYFSSSYLVAQLSSTNQTYVANNSIDITTPLTSTTNNSLTLTAINGFININSDLNFAGALFLNSSNGSGVKLASGTTMTVNRASVNGGLLGQGNIVINSGGYLSVQATTSAGNYTYEGIISGAGYVYLNNAATNASIGSFNPNYQQNFTGNNTYTGYTVLQNGVFNLSTLNNTGSSFGNPSVSDIYLDSATLNALTSGNIARNFYLSKLNFDPTTYTYVGATPTIYVDQDKTFNISGKVNGYSQSGLIKSGPGILNLLGELDIAGTSTINSGIVNVKNTAVFTRLGDVVNNGSLTLDISSDLTYSGVISGTGSLTKLGQGNLTLSGNNTYSGGTTISTGFLIGNSRSLTGNIFNNAALIFEESNSGIFAGNISGNGAVKSRGAGTLSFTGVNSYTGGTTITNGTLMGDARSLTGNFVLSPLSSAIVNSPNNANANVSSSSPSLIFNQINNGIFAGNISGNGSVLSLGAGTLTLTGMNNYTGGTTISGGTLIGNTQSLTGNVANYGTLVFDLTTLGSIFSGDISGSGQLIKQNTGTLILSGNNSYTGGTIINDNGVLKGNTFSLYGDIINNASKLVFDQSYDGVFTGSISGTGQLIKDSTGCSASDCGKLTLSGNISYTGGTTVTGGSVYLQSLNKTFTTNATAFNFATTTTNQIKSTLTAVIQPPPMIFTGNPIMGPALPPPNVNAPPPMMTSSSGNNQTAPAPPPPPPPSNTGGPIPGPQTLSNLPPPPPPPPGGPGNQPLGTNNQFANPITINFVDAQSPPPPPPSNQGVATFQVVEPANKVDAPPPPPLLSAKNTPKDAADSGTNQISTNTVALPSYSSPKQNVRQLNKTTTQVVTSGLSIQRPSKSTPSSGSTLSSNLSIKGNSSNW